MYKQLFLILKQKIEHNELEPGDDFYSENELLKLYDVSRITVRSALQLLETEGFIKKTQGNVSIVQDQNKYTWNLDELTDDLKKFKGDLKTQILSVEKVKPSKRIAKKLRLFDTNTFVYKIDRLRFINNNRMARSISYLIPTLDLDINDLPFDDTYSITELLRTIGENPLYCEETLEAVNADAETCNLLDIPENSAVFFRKRITFDNNNIPLEYVESAYNSNHTKYFINNKLL